MTVTIKRHFGSLAVVIPESIARRMRLTEGMTLAVSYGRDWMVMRRGTHRPPRRPIAEIVAQINPAAYRRRSRELADDVPRGKEIG